MPKHPVRYNVPRHLQLTEDLARDADRAAEERGQTFADFAREALRQFIRQTVGDPNVRIPTAVDVRYPHGSDPTDSTP